MRVVIQRVNNATLISGEFRSEIGFGLLVTVGISTNDTIYDVKYLAHKIANLRVFKDENNKTNLSLLDVDGEMMVVSNFTLQANCVRGLRPDFSRAMESEDALVLYNMLIDEFKKQGIKKVEIGSFGNHMHIETNLDGPFNLILESEGKTSEWEISRIV